MTLAVVRRPAALAPGLVALAALAALCLGPRLAPAADSVPFDSHFAGTFTLEVDDVTGIGDLRFGGIGIATHLGLSAVDGQSITIPTPNPLCSIIDEEHDLVTLVAANGDELHLSNSGEDCLDPFSIPGRIVIRGSGTFRVTGGTGRFAGATGTGTFEVVAVAEATEFGPTGGIGTFDLRFTGTISPARN